MVLSIHGKRGKHTDFNRVIIEINLSTENKGSHQYSIGDLRDPTLKSPSFLN